MNTETKISKADLPDTVVAQLFPKTSHSAQKSKNTLLTATYVNVWFKASKMPHVLRVI